MTKQGPWPFPTTVLCVCETHALIGYRLQVRVQDQEVLLPVGVWTPQPTSAFGEFDVLRDLASELRQTVDEDHLVIPRWWRPKETFEIQTRETLSRAGDSSSKAEAFIARLKTRYTAVQKWRARRGKQNGER